MNPFSGKTILVTGASSGIGEAIVRRLKRQHTTLLLTARSEEALQRLAADVREGGSDAHVYPHDLGQWGAAQALFDRIAADGHSIDVLVNNAGFGKVGRFERHEATTYAEMVHLNTTALTELAALCLPAMLDQGAGGILNVASTAAYQPIPYMAVYAATKHYVLAFSEALHYECAGRGVTVTALCPGPTRTGFGDRAHMRASFFARGATADAVARDGLAGLLAGERVVVSGTINKIGAALAGALPTPLTAVVARRLFAPGDGSS